MNIVDLKEGEVKTYNLTRDIRNDAYSAAERGAAGQKLIPVFREDSSWEDEGDGSFYNLSSDSLITKDHPNYAAFQKYLVPLSEPRWGTTPHHARVRAEREGRTMHEDARAIIKDAQKIIRGKRT